jgi:hypothetical protein
MSSITKHTMAFTEKTLLSNIDTKILIKLEKFTKNGKGNILQMRGEWIVNTKPWSNWFTSRKGPEF